MSNKLLKVIAVMAVLFGLIMLVLAVYFYSYYRFSSENAKEVDSMVTEETEKMDEKDKTVPKEETLPPVEEPTVVQPPVTEPPVEEPPTVEPPAEEEPVIREVYLKSYSSFQGINLKPKFSLKGIYAKVGETVRISVDTTSFGTHSFHIDEYNIHKDTPTDEVTVIEFIADKAGEFVFYCNEPGHRSDGQWGTLYVTE